MVVSVCMCVLAVLSQWRDAFILCRNVFNYACTLSIYVKKQQQKTANIAQRIRRTFFGQRWGNIYSGNLCLPPRCSLCLFKGAKYNKDTDHLTGVMRFKFTRLQRHTHTLAGWGRRSKHASAKTNRAQHRTRRLQVFHCDSDKWQRVQHCEYKFAIYSPILMLVIVSSLRGWLCFAPHIYSGIR